MEFISSKANLRKHPAYQLCKLERNIMIRRSGLISMLALTSYLFCGFSQPDSCGPSTGQKVAIVAVVAAVVTTAVAVTVVNSHNRHNIQGCVVAGGTGVGIMQDDSKVFTLVGAPADLKVGDMVRLHGAKVKAKKGSKDGPTFVVEKLKKDYGPCKIPAAPSVAADTNADPASKS
jgi:hypothetical protein